MRTHVPLLLLVLALAMLPGRAQVPGPELVKLTNLTFGWVSMSGVDPTLDMITAFAPTMMCLRDLGYSSGGEAVSGEFSFGDLQVESNFQSAMTALGPGLIRLCHYGFDSNAANVQALPGVLTSTSGEALELSYAQHVGKATLGLSLVPKDSTKLTMAAGPVSVLHGKVETDLGGRLGAMYRLPQNVRLGVDYSYQEDSGTATMLVMPPGATAPQLVTQQNDFITRCQTIGASWQVRPSTSTYASYQKIIANGGNGFAREAELVWFGVQHSITPELAVRANYLDGGQNYSIQWRSPLGVINAAYTHKALLNARDVLGIGDAFFLGLALAM